MHGTIPAFDPVTGPAGNAPEGDWRARLRIRLCYFWRIGRLPDLATPHRFTELVQQRKLGERSARHTLMLDKLAAKRMVAQQIGEDWVVPTLWEGTALPDEAPFAFPAMLKARHGCNQYAALCEAPSQAHWRRLQSVSESWVKKLYGEWLDENAYRDVPRGLLAEAYIGNGRQLPVDYKIYVFGGRATHVQVHLDRAGPHRWILHDRDWCQLVRSSDRPAPPRSLAAMLDAAEMLGAGEDHVRIDFYEVGGKPLFGEFCLYPGSGLDPFAAEWIDMELGDLWRQARIERMANRPAGQAAPSTRLVSCTKTSSRSGSRVVTSSMP